MWALMAPYGIPCPATGTIIQLVNGLAHYDPINRPNNPNIEGLWTGSDIPQSTRVTDGHARTVGPYGDVQLISSSITGSYELPESFMAQFNWNITGSVGGQQFVQFWVRNVQAAGSGNLYNENGILMEANVGIPSYNLFVRSQSVNIGTHNVAAVDTNVNVIQTSRIVVDDRGSDGVKARFYRITDLESPHSITSSLVPVGPEMSASQADEPTHFNICRITMGAQNEWDEFMLMKGFTITVTGLSPGCHAAITHDAGLTSSIVPSAGGVATINLEDFPMPADQVLVLGRDAQTTISLFRSASGIWGGDSYNFIPG